MSNGYICAKLNEVSYRNPEFGLENHGYKIPKGWEVVASSGPRDNL